MAQTEQAALPGRPRLPEGVAVLRRGTSEIQIGLDPRHAVVVGELSEPVLAAACLLDGRFEADQLLGATPAGDRPALRALLHELSNRGLLEDGTPGGPAIPPRLAADVTAWRLRTGNDGTRPVAARREATVLVYGDGRLAIAVGTMLASAGVGGVSVVARGTVRPEDVGCGYLGSDVGRPRRTAGRDALRRCDPEVRTQRVPVREADLVVITDAYVPAPELVGVLLVDAVPHLTARIREGTGIIGPLVVAGRSSCLGCADLHRAERDACWPRVAAQLAGHPRPGDLSCVQATAAFTAEQALRALAWLSFGGQRPPTWDTTIELDVFRGTVGHRRWTPHPACPCGGLPPGDPNL